MYGNLSASGLATCGSDNTTTHPLPATTVTTTPTPQRQSSPTAATLQNHPHLAGNEACRCSSCHLRDRFFPRNQDGRIFLPHPSLSIHSTRLSRSTATTTNTAPPAIPVTRKRNRIESTTSNSHPKFNDGRREGGSRTPHLQTDKGEGSSTGASRMSGNINMGENWTTVPNRSRREVAAIDEPQYTSQMSSTKRDKPEGRSSSGPSKRTQLSKKYDQRPVERPDPRPRIMRSDDAGLPRHYPLTQPSPSQHSQPLEKSRRTRLELYFDKHGTAPQSLLQPRESPPPMAKLETPQSTTPSNTFQRHVSAYGYEPRTTPRHQGLGMSISSYPEPPGHLGTSYRHHDHDYHSASRPESPADAVNLTQDEPKLIRFSSRSENPQPDTTNPTKATSGDKSVNSSPARHASNQLQPQFEGSSSKSSGNAQTQFRFQEPVVPESSHSASPTRPGESSIVHVKWDSERKRRQGYFAQEEGAEKSPFRHYNKANCDFES